MDIAPDNILNAVLDTIHHATVCARNWTASDEFPRDAVFELMDALHELPQIIRRWSDHEIDDILMFLNCFDVQKWRITIDVERHFIPDFAEFFVDRLEQYMGDN